MLSLSKHGRACRGLIACIAATLLTAAAPTIAPANYNAFGIAMLQRSASSTSGNVFISPASIGLSLAMAAEGAAGETRTAILRAAGQPNDAEFTHRNHALLRELAANDSAAVRIANALWLRNDLPPAPAFVHLLQSQYGAQAQALDFGEPSAADTINRWTAEHTLGLIKKIVGETSRDDFAYLTNAISFQGKWSAAFDPAQTQQQKFTSAALVSHDVAMMHRTGSYATADFDRFRAVRMPYGNDGYAAYILLPDGDDPSPLLKQLDAASFARIAANLHPATIALAVPKFTAEYSASLVPELKALGMGPAFGSRANFSRMHAPPPNLFISSVDHAAYVRVDEAGTVAAAATSIGVRTLSMMVPATRPFVVDHPFIFAIRDERSQNLLFIGLIRDV